MSSDSNPWKETENAKPSSAASETLSNQPIQHGIHPDLVDLSALSAPMPALTLSTPATRTDQSTGEDVRDQKQLAPQSPPEPRTAEVPADPPTSSPIPIISPTPQSQLQHIKPHRSIIDEFDPFGQGSEPGSPGTLASFGSAPGGSGRRSRSDSRAGSSRGVDVEAGDVDRLEEQVGEISLGQGQASGSRANSETPKSAKAQGKTKETGGGIDPDLEATSPDSKQSSSRRSTEGQGGSSRSNQMVKQQPQFDFQGFLAQLRLKSADSIQKYLKSFLVSFSRRPFTINEQIKLIHDFLAFIGDKMRHVEPWRSQSTAEFENATEAMEKLVMNRLYTYTFSPQVDSADRPLMTDDLERDAVLSQRIRLFGWIREKHLDVPEGETSQGFLAFAEQELLKVNHYKAPRDKMICILNACKVIFGLIRHESGSSTKSASADDFLPILIFVVLRANPENLISNVEYITRFRGNGKLDGEPGYYLSSLSGAISFIETLDASSLSNITPTEFEENVERSISELPPGTVTAAKPTRSNQNPSDAEGEEPARALTALQPTIALDNTKKFFQRTGELASGAVSRPLSALSKMLLEGVNPVTGSAPGSEDGESGDEGYPGEKQQQYRTPPRRDQTNIRNPQPRSAASRPSANLLEPSSNSTSASPSTGANAGGSPSRPSFLNNSPMAGWLPRRPSASNSSSPSKAHRHDGSLGGAVAAAAGEHMAGRSQVDEMYARSQVDCEAPASGTQTPSDPTYNYASLTAEIDRTHQTAQKAGVQTLHQMFPGLPEEVCGVVLESCGGDLGEAIDRMLEMTAGS